MSIISWFKNLRISKQKVSNNTNTELMFEQAVVSVCRLCKRDKLRTIQAGSYIIISQLDIYNDSNTKIAKRFIFKINENRSYKIDDIICQGYIVTERVHFKDKYGVVGFTNAIISYNNNDKNLTLREVRDKYLPKLSLANIKDNDVYKTTSPNIVYVSDLPENFLISPQKMADYPIRVDMFIQEITGNKNNS